MLFSKPNKAVGIDIGTHSVKIVQMSRKSGRFSVDRAGFATLDSDRLNVDALDAQARAVRNALQFILLSQTVVVGALPGQTVVIRYPRMPEMSTAQMPSAIEGEASQSIPYELAEVFLDYAVIDRITEGERALQKILLVAAKHEVIDQRLQIADAADVQYSILGVDSLALADAAESCDFLRVGETVALVNVGAVNTSIHFVKDGRSSFVRDVSWGGRELVQAISKSRRCDAKLAEQILVTGIPDEPEPPSPPPLNEADAPESSPLGSLGSSILDPLDDEGAGKPIESRGPAIGSAPPDKPLQEILEAPLGRLVNEIRRSFDYYEQQLYEHSVERIILSGGVALLPLVRDTIRSELGLDNVEVADPTRSALLMPDSAAVLDLIDHPAQFMVAIGLAARGAAEL